MAYVLAEWSFGVFGAFSWAMGRLLLALVNFGQWTFAFGARSYLDPIIHLRRKLQIEFDENQLNKSVI